MSHSPVADRLVPVADGLVPVANRLVPVADVWFPLPTAWLPLPMVWFPAKAHKNADFVLGRGQNQGNIAVSDTKMPILCSGREKIGIGKRNRCLPANHRARF